MILLNSYELIILNAEIYMVQNIELIAILLNIVKVLIILLIYLAVLICFADQCYRMIKPMILTCFGKKSYCLALHVKLGFFLRQSTF